MNTLGLVNVLNNDGNVLIDVAQMADNHIQNAAIHNALAEWNETDDPFSPETTQRLIGKLKGEMPSLIAWLSEGNYPKSGLVPELLAYVKMPHPLQVYKNLDLDITIEDSEKGPASRKAGIFSRRLAPCFSMRVSACSIARAAIR